MKTIIAITLTSACMLICGCKSTECDDFTKDTETSISTSSNPQLTPQTPWWIY